MIGWLKLGWATCLVIKVAHLVVIFIVDEFFDHYFIILEIMIVCHKHIVDATLLHSCFLTVFVCCKILVIFLLVFANLVCLNLHLCVQVQKL